MKAEPQAPLVTVRELAAEIGMDRSHLRKYVLKHQVPTCFIRTPEGGMQRELAVTREDADRVHALRKAEGFITPRSPIRSLPE